MWLLWSYVCCVCCAMCDVSTYVRWVVVVSRVAGQRGRHRLHVHKPPCCLPYEFAHYMDLSSCVLDHTHTTKKHTFSHDEIANRYEIGEQRSHSIDVAAPRVETPKRYRFTTTRKCLKRVLTHDWFPLTFASFIDDPAWLNEAKTAETGNKRLTTVSIDILLSVAGVITPTFHDKRPAQS